MGAMRGDLAVITGATGGLGGACAARFAPTHRLLITDVDDGRLEEAAERLRASGAEVDTLACDLTDPAQVERLASAAEQAGRIQAIVNAGGLSPSMADAWRIIDVNLFGTLNLLDAFVPRVGPGAAAVCIASMVGGRRGMHQFDQLLADPRADDFRRRLTAEARIEGKPGRGYALSKRGVMLQVELRAAEWGKRDARLVSVSPGLIEDTPMGRLEADKGASGLLAVAALKRHATAGDIADACAFLASPHARCVTGTDLLVDGGAVPGFFLHADPAVAAAWDDPDY